MSDDLKVFEQRDVLGKDFKIYGDPDNPLFLAKDVAEWINYDQNKVNDLVAMVDDNEKLTETISWSGQGRKMWFLTEDGLYEVLFQSRKPIAKEFKKQVKKILMEIRRRGIYVTDAALENMLSSPDFGIRLLNEIKSEREKIAVLEHKIEEDKPKVEFANAIEATKDQLTEREMREKRVEELRDYLVAQESVIEKFDDVLFRRFVEKVMVQSMAEVAFLLKVGVEVREIL